MSEPGAKSSAIWLVSGRVQGVGYRWFVLREAEALGVGGWVRNLPDGRVEVAGKGTSAQLLALEALIRRGPGAAHVESVEKLNVQRDMGQSNMFTII
jgi:acylphosphatase